jgi:hypothetical protein
MTTLAEAVEGTLRDLEALRAERDRLAAELAQLRASVDGLRWNWTPHHLAERFREDSIAAAEAAQEVIASQAQEIARLGVEVQAAEDMLLVERRERDALIAGAIKERDAALRCLTELGAKLAEADRASAESRAENAARLAQVEPKEVGTHAACLAHDAARDAYVAVIEAAPLPDKFELPAELWTEWRSRLGAYDRTLPTGTRIGKRWCMTDRNGVSWLREYVEVPGHANRVGIYSREVVLTDV